MSGVIMKITLFLLATSALLLSVVRASPLEEDEVGKKQSPGVLAELESLLNKAAIQRAEGELPEEEDMIKRDALTEEDEAPLSEELAQLQSILNKQSPSDADDEERGQTLEDLLTAQKMGEIQDEDNDQELKKIQANLQAPAKFQWLPTHRQFNDFKRNVENYYNTYVTHVRNYYNSHKNSMNSVYLQNVAKTNHYFQRISQKMNAYIPKHKPSSNEAKEWLQSLSNGVNGLLDKVVVLVKPKNRRG